MAFYFALFNVSNVNQELRGARKAERKEREKRRHSLAATTCLSTARDYRLLPKPRIVLHPDPASDEPGHREAKSARRASSPDTKLQRRRPSTCRMDSHDLDRISDDLRKVRFNGAKCKKGRDRLNPEDCVDEPVWMRRQVVDLSDSSKEQTDADKRLSDPWVYSIDLDKAQRGRRRSSSSHSGILASMLSSFPTDTTCTLSPKETNSADTTTSPSSSSEPVWHRPAMGVSGLESRSARSRRDQGEQLEPLREELVSHINTWPEMNQKKKLRWRPTSLMRRHSETFTQPVLKPVRSQSQAPGLLTPVVLNSGATTPTPTLVIPHSKSIHSFCSAREVRQTSPELADPASFMHSSSGVESEAEALLSPRTPRNSPAPAAHAKPKSNNNGPGKFQNGVLAKLCGAKAVDADQESLNGNYTLAQPATARVHVVKVVQQGPRQPAESKPHKCRPLVVTPVDVNTKSKIFRDHLANLAKPFGGKDDMENRTAPLISMDDEFDDPRLSAAPIENNMIRSSVF